MSIFDWREDYSVKNQEMDGHHKALFEKARNLVEVIDENEEHAVIEKVLNFLIQYAEFHFKAEEVLMKQHNFPDYENHCKQHNSFLKKIHELKEQFKSRDIEMDMDFIDFLKNWVINHILTEDRKYGQFLNRKGVY